jgi:hypothetical protein
MRLNGSMTRILFLLIVLRMLAAPVALRPDAPKAPIYHRFIVRMCAWPAHRPQRINAAEHLVSRPDGDDRRARADLDRASRTRSAVPLIRGYLSLLVRRTPHTVHLSDCPRC